MNILYDAGVLIAAERGDREVRAEHRVRLELDLLPRTTAPVVAQASRSPRHAQLRRFRRGCQIEGFEPERAHEAGSLLRKAGAADVVGAHMVVVAARTDAAVLTADPDDIQRLSARLSPPVPVRRLWVERAGRAAARPLAQPGPSTYNAHFRPGDWCIGNTAVSKTATPGSTPGSPVSLYKAKSRMNTRDSGLSGKHGSSAQVRSKPPETGPHWPATGPRFGNGAPLGGEGELDERTRRSRS
jgi:hypothetical protein